ncbi:hypothetical protein Tco_0118779, partial [Tanacetum coccineum]
GPQEPEPNVSDDRSSEYSTCQSNDSARSIGTSSEHSANSESEISNKMAKEAEVKKQRVCNTGNMMAKPIWTNTNRINHANQFVPRPVQLNTGRPNINSVRTNINTDSQYLPGHPFAKITAQMSHSNDVKGNWGSVVKTSAGYN